MQVVDNACRVIGGKLMMVIESENLNELLDHQVTKFAVEHATRFGWPNACLNGQDAPVPVDASGNSPENYDDMVKLANNGGTTRYRKRIYLTTRF